MSKPIPQIRVPELDALVVGGAFHLDHVQIIGREDELGSPAWAIVVERYCEESLGT
jgi:hypothetical protein